MDATIIVALISAGGGILIAAGGWIHAQRKAAREEKQTLLDKTEAIAERHRADYDIERERRIAADARSDAFEKEADRLRGLLRVLIGWVASGANPPPPSITEKDLWSD